MAVVRSCASAALFAALALTVMPAAAQQAAPATEAGDEEAGTRGVKGKAPTRPAPTTQPVSKPVIPSPGGPAAGGKPGTSGTFTGLPPRPGSATTDPGKGSDNTLPGAKPPGTDTGTPPGGDTKTIMPVPTGPVVMPPRQGPIVSYPPPGTAYPPGGPPATGGAPAPRPAPQSQQASPGVSCGIGANGVTTVCVVDNDNDGQEDPNSDVLDLPAGTAAVQVGEYVYVDLDGDGNVDFVLRGGLVQGVPVQGSNKVVDVVKLTDVTGSVGLPPGSVSLDGVNVSSGDISDFNGDGRPDAVFQPTKPDGSRVRIVDLPINGALPPKNGAGPKPPGPPGGARPPRIAALVAAYLAGVRPICEEPGLEVLPRLDCLKRAFEADRFGAAEYEERKARALTLIDAPRMGPEQALQALNEALRRSLITQNNYYTKVNQVISRL